MVDFRAVRVLGLAELTMQEGLVSALSSLQVQVHLVERLTDFPRVPAVAGVKDILLLSSKCDDEGAWVIRGVLSEFTTLPPFIVYADEVSFANWSGVLDSGGAEMITAPFSLDKVRLAVAKAAAMDPPREIEETAS